MPSDKDIPANETSDEDMLAEIDEMLGVVPTSPNTEGEAVAGEQPAPEVEGEPELSEADTEPSVGEGEKKEGGDKEPEKEPAAEEVKAEEPEGEGVSGEPEEQPEVAEPAKAEDAMDTEVKEPAEDPRDAIIESLRSIIAKGGYAEPAQVAELTKGEAKPAVPQVPQVPQQPKVPLQVQEPPQAADDEFVITDEVYEKALSSKEGLSELINTVRTKAARDVILSLPEAVNNLVSSQFEVLSVVQNFYRSNPDLERFKHYVGSVSKEIASQNPNMDYDELLVRTAEKARKDLGLAAPNPVQQSAQTKGSNQSHKKLSGNPALPRGKTRGKRLPAPTPTGLQAEIDALIETTEGG